MGRAIFAASRLLRPIPIRLLVGFGPVGHIDIQFLPTRYAQGGMRRIGPVLNVETP